MSDVTPPADPSRNGSLSDLPVLDPKTAPVLEPVVRAPALFWDRIKVLLALIALWWLLLWGDLANNPIESFSVAFGQQLRSFWWLEGLLGLEVIRQIHYLISEHSPRWNRAFTVGAASRLVRPGRNMTDWTRFRVARVVRVLVILAALALILGAFFHVSPLASLFLVPSALFTALPFILQIVFVMLFGIMQFVAIFWFMSKGGIDVYYPGDVRTRFSDVWGQDAVLERVKESILYLKDPESIEKRGGYVPGGILLWGPPGTGKTLIAEAVAGETENPFVFVDPGAFNAMFFGVGILKVKGLFRKLRKLAIRYGGVVVFFDEADSLGNRGSLTPGGIFGPGRFSPHSLAGDHALCNGLSYLHPNTASELFLDSLQRHSEPDDVRQRRFPGVVMGGYGGGGGMGTLQSLLSEMSGLTKPRGFMNRVVRRALGMKPAPPPKYRILVMMATNQPDVLDEALLRPGRIDRIYKVGYPSKSGRIRTYHGYFDKIAHSLTDEEIERLATITPYATGATIKDLVNESLIISIRENRDVVTWGDVMRAKQLKALGPPEDVEYVERERHAVAIHEACHAVAAARLRKSLLIDLATIEKGGTYLGMVSSVRAEDTFTRWRSDYETDVIVSLASLAGEKMFFQGDSSSGVSGDLNSATIVATYMEGFWGMGLTVASHGITKEAGIGGSGVRDRRRDERGMIGERGLGDRIEQKLLDLLQKTVTLIEANRNEVLAIAHALEKHKTLTGDDVLAIVNGTKGPLVDGRVYHTPRFRELAEAYHEQAVRAHREQGQVDLPLPELPEFDDSLVLDAVGSDPDPVL